MREIKFRAWDSLNEHIVTMDRYEDPEDKRIQKTISNFWFMVYEHGYELMQYTGLKDKNGKEIYEGDIMEVDVTGNPIVGVVTWDNQFSQFRIIRGGYSSLLNFTKDNVLATEIIGNLYKNPELTK